MFDSNIYEISDYSCGLFYIGTTVFGQGNVHSRKIPPEYLRISSASFFNQQVKTGKIMVPKITLQKESTKVNFFSLL